MKRKAEPITLELHQWPGLTIDEVKHKPRKKIKCHPLLPQPPFMMLMAAPRFSGKTNLLIKSLVEDEIYCKKFDEIFIWSKSYHNDDKWRAIRLPDGYEEDHVFEQFDEGRVSEIFEELKEKSKHETRHVLMIFDDMMGEKIMQPNKMQTLDRVASTGRHFDISVVVIFQKFKKFSPTVRDNATNVIIFEQKNATALEQIADEYKGSLSFPHFMKIYDVATSEPFNFLHINLQEPDRQKRFRKNWNTIIRYETPDENGTQTTTPGSREKSGKNPL